MVRVITGPNEFMAKQAYKNAVDEFVRQNGDLALERIDCSESDINSVIAAVSNLPFLAPQKMVVLKNLSENKELAEQTEKIISRVSEGNEVLIFDLNIDKRTAYYKALQKNANLEEYKELDERALANWLQTYVKDNGGEISYADAVYLIGRVGQNQLRLAGEIDKLVIYESKVNKQNIDLLTEPTPQSKIFDLMDAAFAGNTKNALQIYDEQRKLKVEPQQIIGMLAWQLNAIALVKYAGDRTNQQIAKDSGLNPYVIQKSRALAAKLTLVKLKKLISELVAIDVASKTSTIDADNAIRHYIITIA